MIGMNYCPYHLVIHSEQQCPACALQKLMAFLKKHYNIVDEMWQQTTGRIANEGYIFKNELKKIIGGEEL